MSPKIGRNRELGAVVGRGSRGVGNPRFRSAASQERRQASAAESSPETAAKIAQWITQLGDSEYPTREKAQEELRRLGTAAFDELLAAQDHPDVEIAQRARYLVRSIPVAWSLDSDPAEVKSFLVNFGELGRNERMTRAQHLATLERGVGDRSVVPDRAI